ncbi:MAG TPA: response regulator transcription factor [Dehalococcoidia bacterium]|nr:response regulator transcription factor [Dehalococcoidia bacterium]
MYEQTKVLVVGTDRTEANRVADWLAQTQYSTITAGHWDQGLRQLYTARPDALILLNAPGSPVQWKDVDVVRSLCDIPVFVVADRANRASLEKALDLGLAGYLVRPLQFRSLTERLTRVLQKTPTNRLVPSGVFQYENLTIDWRRFEVRVDGHPVRLSTKEFALLSLLVERQGEVVMYGEILSKVWGQNYDLMERRNVKLYIWYLRRKLERDPTRPRWILTKNGLGYMFASEPDDSCDAADAEGCGRHAPARRRYPRRPPESTSAR